MNFDIQTVEALMSLCVKNGISHFKLANLVMDFTSTTPLDLPEDEIQEDYKPSKTDPLSMQMWTEEMTNG